MSGPCRFCLVLVALMLLSSAQAWAEGTSPRPELDPKIKTEMKALQTQIKTDRAFLKGEREKLKPVVERLKANNAKLRQLREKAKAQRDALRATQSTKGDAPLSTGVEDDPFDDILTPQ